MSTLGINSCPSPVSKPQTPFLRTYGSRNHGQHQRPQQARWGFRWDGALPLKAADAPAEQQTQHGISETRFENSQHPGEPCLASVYPEGVCCGQFHSVWAWGRVVQLVLGQLLACDLQLKRFMVCQAEGRGCSTGKRTGFPKILSIVESTESAWEPLLDGQAEYSL